jgi:hypothetical protein
VVGVRFRALLKRVMYDVYIAACGDLFQCGKIVDVDGNGGVACDCVGQEGCETDVKRGHHT